MHIHKLKTCISTHKEISHWENGNSLLIFLSTSPDRYVVSSFGKNYKTKGV